MLGIDVEGNDPPRVDADYFRGKENRTPTRKDWERLSTAWRDDLKGQITQLEHLRDRLAGCIGCGCLSLQSCQLINPDDVLGRRGSGPRNL